MSGFEARNKSGASETAGMVQTFAVDAGHTTLLAKGDVVVITGNGDVNGVSEVDTGNASTLNTGVIASVDFTLAGEALTETGLLALTAGTVKVNQDPNQLYEVETDATVTVADVGLNCAINTTAATKSGGLTISNMNVDAGTITTSTALPFRIVALLLGKTSGVLGDRVLVRPNATTQSTGAVGIS